MCMKVLLRFAFLSTLTAVLLARPLPAFAAEAGSGDKADTNPAVKVNTAPAPEPEAEPEKKPEVKAEVKPEIKPEPKAETKAEARGAQEAPAPEVVTGTEPDAEPKPAVEAGAQEDKTVYTVPAGQALPAEETPAGPQALEPVKKPEPPVPAELTVQVVEEEEGTPVPGARVIVYWQGMDPSRGRIMDRISTLATSVDGTVKLRTGPKASVQSIAVSALGFRSAGEGAVRLPARVVIALEEIEPEEPKTGALTVKTVNAKDGKALTGISVSVLSSEGFVARATTGAGGKASFDQLPLGACEIRVGGRDLQARSMRSTVTARPDQVLFALSSRPVSFEVLVLDAENRPASAIEVSAGWHDGYDQVDRTEKVISGDDGRALFYDIPADTRVIFTARSTDGKQSVSARHDVRKVPDKMTLKVGPEEVRKLDVRIVDAETGDPLGGARLTVKLKDGDVSAIGAPGSGAVLLPAIPAGSYDCLFEARGYKPVLRKMEVPFPQDMTVKLDPLAPRLSVSVNNVLGLPVKDAQVSVHWPDPASGDTVTESARTNSQGVARFYRVPADRDLYLNAGGKNYQPLVERVKAGQEQVELVLPDFHESRKSLQISR